MRLPERALGCIHGSDERPAVLRDCRPERLRVWASVIATAAQDTCGKQDRKSAPSQCCAKGVTRSRSNIRKAHLAPAVLVTVATSQLNRPRASGRFPRPSKGCRNGRPARVYQGWIRWWAVVDPDRLAQVVSSLCDRFNSPTRHGSRWSLRGPTAARSCGTTT